MKTYVVCVPTKDSYATNYPTLFAFSAPDDATALDYFDKERLRSLYLNQESRLASGGVNWVLLAQLFPSGSTQRLDTPLGQRDKTDCLWLKKRYEELRDRWNQITVMGRFGEMYK